MSARLNICILIALAIFSFPASGQQKFEKARKLFFSYHENLGNIEKSIKMLEGFVENYPKHSTAMTLISRAYLTYGDSVAKTEEEKLKAYEKGAEWGKKAVEAGEENARAHFWYFANLGRVQEIKGLFYGLRILKTLKYHINRAYQLSPEDAGILSALGSFYRELPGFVGGDRKKSEEFFKKAISADPKYSLAYYEYALLLYKEKRYREAKRVLLKAINMKNPTYIADWVVWDEPHARELLRKVEKKLKK